ncbi:MAG: nucleoside hydrolase, partial [Pseudomonadota bacterium]
LDVTERVQCTPKDFASLAEAKPTAGGFLRDAGRFYMDFHVKSVGFEGCFMHDPSAVIAVVRPELFRTEYIPLTAQCSGPRIGSIRQADDGRGAVGVCTDVEADKVRRRFLDVIAAGPLP